LAYTGSDSKWSAVFGGGDTRVAELIGQVQCGDHPDHADVTCSGGEVNGQVLVLE